MRNPAAVLAMIQKKEGTTGMPPTAAEERLARIIVSRGGRAVKPTDPEETRRVAFSKKMEQEKRHEAARRVAHNLAVKAAQEAEEKRRAAQEEAEAQIRAEMGRV